VTRLQFSRRGDGLAARVAVLCAGLMVAALVVGAGGVSAAAGPSGSTSSAESFQTTHAGAIDGLATTNSARFRLLPAGVKAISLGLAAVFLTGTGVHLAMRTRRSRRAHLVVGDVGDRWRALLIGAPPALFSF
jgi:hypothetical protein